MAKAKDLILLENDLDFADGDFAVDLSDEQHIEHILIADKGNWRNAPVLGVGLYRELQGVRNAITDSKLDKKIRANLGFDGFRVKSVVFGGNLAVSIDAERIK